MRRSQNYIFLFDILHWNPHTPWLIFAFSCFLLSLCIQVYDQQLRHAERLEGVIYIVWATLELGYFMWAY